MTKTIAKQLREQGWSVVPIPKGSKAATGPLTTSRRTTTSP
jgi:hypothetical protein